MSRWRFVVCASLPETRAAASPASVDRRKPRGILMMRQVRWTTATGVFFILATIAAAVAISTASKQLAPTTVRTAGPGGLGGGLIIPLAALRPATQKNGKMIGERTS